MMNDAADKNGNCSKTGKETFLRPSIKVGTCNKKYRRGLLVVILKKIRSG